MNSFSSCDLLTYLIPIDRKYPTLYNLLDSILWPGHLRFKSGCGLGLFWSLALEKK